MDNLKNVLTRSFSWKVSEMWQNNENLIYSHYINAPILVYSFNLFFYILVLILNTPAHFLAINHNNLRMTDVDTK